jgi:hypothetical protein
MSADNSSRDGMSEYQPIPGWVVEVLGDGTGARHRRYLVGAAHREAAIAAVVVLLGPDTTITSTTPIEPQTFGISKVQPGEVFPL